MERRAITINDLFHLRVVNDPQISPDGKRLIYAVKTNHRENNRYRSHLYVLEISSGVVRQFTQGEVNDQSPRWSPDGTEIAFLRTKEKDTQIWLISSGGGEASPLTKLEEGNIGDFLWSPDGTQLACELRLTHPDWTRQAREKREQDGLSNPPRLIDRFHYRLDGEGFLDLHQHIWVCDSVSGKAQPLTDGPWEDRSPTWSPDGRSIAFISNRSDDPESKPFEEDIWIISVEGRQPKKIPSPNGYKWGLNWSPEGDYLAYIGTQTQEDPWVVRNDRLWVVPLQAGQARCLTEKLDRTIDNASLSDVRGTGNQAPLWSEDGDQLFFLVSDRGNCHLYSVSLTGDPKAIIEGKLDITGFCIDANANTIAALASNPTQPTEIFILNRDADPADEALIPLTRTNESLLHEIQLSPPEEVWIKSQDNIEIQGWLLKPPAFDPQKQYPLVLYIHGGPPAQYGNTFFHEFQVLAGCGYIVLYTNPRGSLGREEDFATCIQGDWGNLDYLDLMAAADYADTLAYVDNTQMAVVGGSYGGFMATWIVGHTNRFRCAITERAVSNRHSAVGTSDFPAMPDGYWSGNTWDRPERLWDQSPLRFAANIQTPLLIIHSEGDLRCPIGQAEELFSALKRLKREVLFLRYPYETSHGLSRNGPPDLRIDRLQRIVAWLDQHLK